jgi:hypothetical protein
MFASSPKYPMDDPASNLFHRKGSKQEGDLICNGEESSHQMKSGDDLCQWLVENVI